MTATKLFAQNTVGALLPGQRFIHAQANWLSVGGVGPTHNLTELTLIERTLTELIARRSTARLGRLHP